MSLLIWQNLKLCSHSSRNSGHLNSRRLVRIPIQGGSAEHHQVLQGLSRRGAVVNFLARATQGSNRSESLRADAVCRGIFLVRSRCIV